jgi:hypothetical protein
MNNLKLPNFLIIGAARSGTTSLYYYLNQHPEIFMPKGVKEPSFFSFKNQNLKNYINFSPAYREQITTTHLDYQKLFEDVNNEIAIGEASNAYMYYRPTASTIKKYLPDVKVIAILRNPIERAFSHFVTNVMHNRESENDFEKAVLAEQSRIENNWEWGYHYINVGFYYRQLKEYFDLFERNKIHICLHHEFKANPKLVLKDIFSFLKVKTNYIPDLSYTHSVSGLPKNNNYYFFYRNINYVKFFISEKLYYNLKENLRKKAFSKPIISINTKNKLKRIYQNDIEKLELLIEKDLSVWLK